MGDGAHRRCGNQAVLSNLVFELHTLLNMLYELVDKILNGFFLKRIKYQSVPSVI